MARRTRLKERGRGTSAKGSGSARCLWSILWNLPFRAVVNLMEPTINVDRAVVNLMEEPTISSDEENLGAISV